MLLGRDRELERIDAVLHGARSGTSATLALIGEPGIGKTVLLEAAVDRARDMTVLRVAGVESEADIAFASLFSLLRPVLDLLGEIPEPQAIALESALALRPAAGQERFAVGAATLSLLAAAAERSPLLVLIDDTQWLDRSSAQALLFAFRRLIAERVAVVMTVRAGEASLVDGTDLPVMTLDGLSAGEAAVLLEGLEPDTVGRLHRTTGGNPLALLELAKDPGDVALAPADAPLLVSERIGRAFAGRLSGLDEAERRAVSLAAASDNGELGILAAAAAELGVDLSRLSGAEAAGLVTVRAGNVEFSHPLARSAVYAATPAGERRAAHQALAGALPDRDIDSRAWHFAAAAIGSDEVAAAAVEQAGVRSRDRGAYASAAAAFERAARLTAEPERRARLLADAAEACWQAGSADRSLALLDECAVVATEPATVLDVEELRGRIATRQGPVMRGCEILSQAAGAATGERAVTLLAEATIAALYAGRPREMMALAARARAAVPVPASPRAQFLAAAASGMAEVVGGDAASGTQALHEAIGIVDESETIEDLRLLPWLVLAPIFLRDAESGRSLIERAVASARERAAVSTLPFVLNLIARDDATTDRWVAAEAAYREAIELARENDQRTDLAFGLSGLAWLVARRGEELECRALAAEALELCASLGTALHAIWVTAALGELELALGDAASAVERFEDQRRLLRERGITDPDLSPAPELVEAYLRLQRDAEARAAADEFLALARAKAQSWSLGRALRAAALVAPDAEMARGFEDALEQHALTPDLFEAARTRLLYGERLRRAGNRSAARPHLRTAIEEFEHLGARLWAERARDELAATGETARRRDPTTLDELTPRELQISLLLAAGKTTREAAAAVFLSPKTVEYHLRHVYQKLGIHSREELAGALAPIGLRETGVSG